VSNVRRYVHQPPMSPADLLKHERAQALERSRRGFGDFTRPERREEVMGQTSGEARLQTTQRYSQVSRKKRK